MMPALAFLLECAAVAALVCLLASLLVGLVLRLPTPGFRPPPAPRADGVFLLGTLPLQAALAVVAAAAAPSLGAWMGVAHDHCQGHGHHIHLCFLHASRWRPLLAGGGALALAAFLFRLGGRLRHLFRTHARLSALEALGSRSPGAFPVISVPGTPRLCHAAGVFRRRILLSSALERALAPDALRAALAHEEAHLRRRDPLALLLLSLAGLFLPPSLARAVTSSYLAAAEEACDAEAARALGDATVVADALVKMAALQRSAFTAPHVPAFGALELEQRVRHLLEDERPRTAPSRALLLSVSLGSALFAFALLHAYVLHHAVETALHFFS